MDPESPPSVPAKPSTIPSWVTLGFVLGALFVLALPRHPAGQPEVQPAPRAPVLSDGPAAAPQISTIEAVFDVWGKYAVWEEGTTQVALWNSQSRSFSDCFEVVRVGDQNYFRSIPRLSRPILTHGIDEKSPLQFTETQGQRETWLEDARKETWNEFSEANRAQPAPGVEKKPDRN